MKKTPKVIINHLTTGSSKTPFCGNKQVRETVGGDSFFLCHYVLEKKHVFSMLEPICKNCERTKKFKNTVSKLRQNIAYLKATFFKFDEVS